jgi:hypothetical protein
MGTVYDRGVFRAATVLAFVLLVAGPLLIGFGSGSAKDVGVGLLVLGILGGGGSVLTSVMERRRGPSGRKPGYYATPREAGWDKSD